MSKPKEPGTPTVDIDWSAWRDIQLPGLPEMPKLSVPNVTTPLLPKLTYSIDIKQSVDELDRLMKMLESVGIAVMPRGVGVKVIEPTITIDDAEAALDRLLETLERQ